MHGFAKPLDMEMLAQVFEDCRFVVTVEEGALMGGFGSAFWRRHVLMGGTLAS